MKYFLIILLFSSCTVTHICNCKPTTSPILKLWEGDPLPSEWWFAPKMPSGYPILPNDPPGFWGGPYYGPTPSLPIGTLPAVIDTMNLKNLTEWNDTLSLRSTMLMLGNDSLILTSNVDTTVLVTKGWTIKN